MYNMHVQNRFPSTARRADILGSMSNRKIELLIVANVVDIFGLISV